MLWVDCTKMTKFDDVLNLRAVGGSHLFKSLGDEGLSRLLQSATSVSYRQGQFVVREGDPGEALYLIREGQVRVTTNKEDEDVELAILGPGACIGEVALLTGQPRTATVVTLEACTMLCFHKNQIDEILEGYPKVKKLLQSVIMGRAKSTIEKVTQASKPVDPKS